MRARPETLLIGALSFFAVLGLVAVQLMDAPVPGIEPGPMPVDPVQVPPPAQVSQTPQAEAQSWFREIRADCNPVHVETRLRWQPAPDGDVGAMYEAACWALAGRIAEARRAIEELPPGDRHRAAGVVFDAGHPAADAGDDVAAGPLMELVVEYWPNHHMALYHAGAAAWETGNAEDARRYLTRFLEHYRVDDGWRSSAQSMLEALDG